MAWSLRVIWKVKFFKKAKNRCVIDFWIGWDWLLTLNGSLFGILSFYYYWKDKIIGLRDLITKVLVLFKKWDWVVNIPFAPKLISFGLALTAFCSQFGLCFFEKKIVLKVANVIIELKNVYIDILFSIIHFFINWGNQSAYWVELKSARWFILLEYHGILFLFRSKY